MSAGPRYYFLPYAVLGWVLLIIARTSGIKWARPAATTVIVMSLLALPQDFSRHENKVSWTNYLSACATATHPFSVPVEFDGTSHMWDNQLYITVATCRAIEHR